MLDESSDLSRVNEDLRSLAYQLLLGEHRERRYIADQLHDDIAMGLLCCNIKLKMLQEKEAANRGLATSLMQVQEQISQLITSVKQMGVELRPVSLHEFGLEAAISDMVRNIEEKHGMMVDFEYDGPACSLKGDVSIIVYQSIRELLRNVIRHAFAESITIFIQKTDERLEVVIEDDGIGFDYAEFAFSGKQRSKIGLLSIQEWLRHIGGYFEIQSQPGRGTCATIILPLKQ